MRRGEVAMAGLTGAGGGGEEDGGPGWDQIHPWAQTNPEGCKHSLLLTFHIHFHQVTVIVCRKMNPTPKKLNSGGRGRGVRTPNRGLTYFFMPRCFVVVVILNKIKKD